MGAQGIGQFPDDRRKAEVFIRPTRLFVDPTANRMLGVAAIA
jgi:hypothetical protein